MGKIDLAVELFLTQDPQRASQLAKGLCELNRQRQAVESEIYEQAAQMLPEELRPGYEALLLEQDENAATLVKAADKLSAYIKCVEEMEAGNGEFSQAAQETLASLQKMEMPEVAYFLKNFSEAFGLTLDELN